jgi:hypothetical protein
MKIIARMKDLFSDDNSLKTMIIIALSSLAIMFTIGIIEGDTAKLECTRYMKVVYVQPLVHNTRNASWTTYFITYENGTNREMGNDFGTPSIGKDYCIEEQTVITKRGIF